MVQRTFVAHDNNSMLINGDPSRPIINNSDTPNGTVYTFTGGSDRWITLDDTGGGSDTFNDDQASSHIITDGAGLVANGMRVESESHILIRALDANGNPTGNTITLYVFSQNGQTGNVWGFASNAPLQSGTQYIKVGGSNSGSSAYSNFIACFGAGTLIRRPGGKVAVEAIRAGDRVWTQRDPEAEVRWAGRREVAAAGDVAPVVFAPGAIGNDRELVVSPNHRMLVEGWQVELAFGTVAVLVPARHLVGLPGVDRREGGCIAYHHILFDRHETVESNGILSESFFPGPVTMTGIDGSARNEVLRLFPELASDPGCYGETAAPCVTAREAVVLRAALAA